MPVTSSADAESSGPNRPSLGRYTLKEIIGAGAMARVYQADLTGPEGFARRVAIKIVHPHLASAAPDFVRRFIDEARLGGHLYHPNIVGTKDFGEIQGSYFIVMDLVEGPTLADVIRACWGRSIQIPLSIALQVGIQVCDALDFAHHATDNQGRPLEMIHRDIKPSNILLTSQGHVLVADFGIARAATNVLRTVGSGVIKGTIRYMSPEQANGLRELDHRSDLFSLCIILYELAAGRILYDARPAHRCLSQAQEADVGDVGEALGDGDPERQMAAVLRRGLSRDPADRFQSARELGQALHEILHSLPAPPRLGTWLAATGDAVRAAVLAEGEGWSSDELAEDPGRVWRKKPAQARRIEDDAAPEDLAGRVSEEDLPSLELTGSGADTAPTLKTRASATPAQAARSTTQVRAADPAAEPGQAPDPVHEGTSPAIQAGLPLPLWAMAALALGAAAAIVAALALAR